MEAGINSFEHDYGGGGGVVALNRPKGVGEAGTKSFEQASWAHRGLLQLSRRN